VFVSVAFIVVTWLLLVRDEGASFERDADGKVWNRWWQFGLVAQWLLLINIVPFFAIMCKGLARQMYDLAVVADMPATRHAGNARGKTLLTFLPPNPQALC